MNSTSYVPTSSSERLQIFGKFFKWLLAVITLRTQAWEKLCYTHPKIINGSILEIVLYFLTWLFGTTLQSHVRTFLPIRTCIIALLASAASISDLLIISPLIAQRSSPLWVAVFAVIANCWYQQLYEMTFSAILQTIQKMISSYKAKRTKLPVQQLSQ